MAGFSGKKLLLVILALCFAFIALEAESFVLSRLDHGHSGDECSTCRQIEIVQNVLKGLNAALIAAFFAGLVLVADHIKKIMCPYIVCPASPVALNVKSNT
jgi:hypothetical protein